MSSTATMNLLQDSVLLQRAQLSGRSVQEETALALDAGEIPTRYLRNADSLSLTDQACLARSTIVLADCGGLGGHVLEFMLRTGVGRIIACDPDVFEKSHCNRQPLATKSAIGRHKATVAAERAAVVNPLVDVQVSLDVVQAETLQGADVVADCLGGAQRRKALQQLAANAGLPLVSAGVSGFSALVCSTWPGEPGLGEFMSGTMLGSEDVQGVLAATVAFAASLQAAELLRILTKGASTLRGSLLVADIAEMRFNTVSLSTM